MVTASVLGTAVIPAAYAQITQSRPDIQIRFSNNNFQRPTLLGEAVKQGRFNLIVTNRGTAIYQGALNLKIYVSPDSILDKNPLSIPKVITSVATLGTTSNSPLVGTDELLGTQSLPSVSLSPGASQTVTVNFTSSDFRSPSVVAPGAYHLIAEIDTAIPQATTNGKVVNRLVNAGDPVIVWNATLLNSILVSGIFRDANGVLTARGGTPPPIAARNQAIVHLAVYDAVNAINRIGRSYIVRISPSDPRLTGGASAPAAAIQAAYTTLANLFTVSTPQDSPQIQAAKTAIKALLNQQLITSLAAIPNGTAKTNGRSIGREVAKQILALRSNDGSAQAQIPYMGGNIPGEWRPTFPDFTAALLPGWGSVRPFSPNIPNRDPADPRARLLQFGLSGPLKFGSQQFVDAENLVRQVGAFRNTSVTTITRTSGQTKNALFWALDRPNTFRPPGQWNQYAQQISLNKGNNLSQNALLFAQLNLAQADVGILTWDSKYTYNQLRPIQAIRQNNPLDVSGVVRDLNWLPLLSYQDPENFFNTPLTPPFPDYNSGHAAFGAAAGQVLINFFGDNTPFTVPSQDLPGQAFPYNTISEAIEDNAASRIFGGIHVPSSGVTQIPVTDAKPTTPDGRIIRNTVTTSKGTFAIDTAKDPDVQLGIEVSNRIIKLFDYKLNQTIDQPLIEPSLIDQSLIDQFSIDEPSTDQL
ncbi:vanadium-dependent haloperoxidase [Komarekiella sp. 'clone 1']|uniref:Vanadium-dependent haloperoxidase n=1 Tax=Komarekiella delphini-convector SJRDD-AB1 TaxID=2593771 RepID=A0AA40SX88_9NOST|nr:vanadium-dependent haloperoxidase [Komarekiella delphini-convector SJRDD-AB1]